jgi:hypothetical protein
MGARPPVSAVFISIWDDRFEPLVTAGCGAAVAARRLRSAPNADLDHGVGPLIVAIATDISTGGRLDFRQSDFDHLCSHLDAVPALACRRRPVQVFR